MRKIKDVLRLYHEAGLKLGSIARSLQVLPATAGDYLRRAKVTGLA